MLGAAVFFICGGSFRLGEEPKCTGRILGVGIAYRRKDGKKRHECKVEVLRESLVFTGIKIF